MFSKSVRQLVFMDDISIVGHAISTPAKEIPSLPDDVTVNRGLFGHYLSRKVSYKKGDTVRPQHWHKSGESVDFDTGVFSFSVPMGMVQLKNPETGKQIPINPKFQGEVS